MYSGLVLKYNNECLLCKRSSKYSHPNKWFIPAGKIEKGETPRDATVREVFEETTLEFNESDIDFIGLIPSLDDYTDFVYIFKTELEDKVFPDLENAIDGKEHTKCDYFSLSKIKSLGVDDRLVNILKKIL
jgi:8-oxo-dGTP pyrophosphatase MutT (NUDIX family)